MSAHDQYNKNFNHFYQRLNEAQRAAVDHTDGPVLVVAGPGTGKTQILSTRIGNILSKTDIRPYNILCLTYTEAGAVAMRNRLMQVIGPDAYRVYVHTFHSFCNQVIQDNRFVFGGYRDLKPVEELEQVSIFYQLIDGFGKDHPLKRFSGDAYFESRRLKTLFGKMKEENLTPSFLVQKADEFLETMPDLPFFQYKKKYKDFNAGDLKESAADPYRKGLSLLKAAAGEFENFNRLMAKADRYDYQDMILWVLKAFKEDTNLLARYQEQFQYILVDEFQDTNRSQNELLNLLTDYWGDNPNLFVVGDDDQSVYSFQGANVRRITDFIRKYRQNLFAVVLTENYRSVQNILDAGGRVIAFNKERLVNDAILKHILPDISKNLTSSLPRWQGNQVKVQILACLNQYHEEAWIVKQLEKLRDSGVSLSETAIIYRNHRQVERIEKILQYRKIPYNARRRVNVLEMPVILKSISILEYLHQENRRPGYGEPQLFELLHFDFLGIPASDIVRLRLESRDQGITMRKLMQSRELMFRAGIQHINGFSRAELVLDTLQKELHDSTIQVLFETLINLSGMLEYVMQSEEKLLLLQAITTFFDFVKEKSTRKTAFGLAQLLDDIEKMRDNDITLPMELITTSADGVHLVTAHSSKGLEYGHVFMIGCIGKNWELKQSRTDGYKMPPNLYEGWEAKFESGGKDEEKAAAEEEERRLFYVAMTRAKEHLYISYPKMKTSDKSEEQATNLHSSFIACLLEEEAKSLVDFIEMKLPEEDLVRYSYELLFPTVKPTVKEVEAAYLKRKLGHYSLSVTHLNKYLKCPLSFYYENVLQVPSARRPQAGFGSAIHKALETFYNLMLASPERNFPEESELTDLFRLGMEKYHANFSDKEYERYLDYGARFLPKLYHEYILTSPRNVSIEYRIAQIEVDGVSLNGMLDKVEKNGRSVNVVDYKTGKPDKQKIAKRLRRPDPDAIPGEDEEEKLIGGEYWRQLVFYKILVDAQRSKDWHMETGQILFIEPDQDGNFVHQPPLTILPDDIKTVKEQMATVYGRIMAHDFYTGCGKEDCNWCRFVKNHYTVNTVTEVEDDEEEPTPTAFSADSGD